MNHNALSDDIQMEEDSVIKHNTSKLWTRSCFQRGSVAGWRARREGSSGCPKTTWASMDQSIMMEGDIK